MFVEFPTRYFNGLARTTTGKQGPHDLSGAHAQSEPVISRHTAPHVALGDDADQQKVFSILNHRLRSRSLIYASRAPTNLAAYSTKTLRRVSSHRYNDSFFLSSFMPCATIH